MKIIDSSLYFFLRHCERNKILADLPDPFVEKRPGPVTGELF